MRILRLILFLFILFRAGSSAHAAWCSAANLYNAGTATPTDISNSAAATYTVTGASKNGKRVYWSFTATNGVTYHFDLSQSTSNDDTYMNIYNNTGGLGNGTSVASNDDFNTYSDDNNGFAGGAPIYYPLPATTKSGLNWTCAATGTYYVSITLNGGTTCDVLTNNGNLVLNCYYNAGSCGGTINLPFTENFSAWGNCWTSNRTLLTGSGSSSTAWEVWGSGDATASGAAGANSPEAVLAGNQSCSGCTEALTYTLQRPINTTGVVGLQFSFVHTLYTTAGSDAANGSVNGTMYLETATSLAGPWTARWTQAYAGNAGTSALTKIYEGAAVTTASFNPGSATLYMRFRIDGVMYKIYQWHIDNKPNAPTLLPVELTKFNCKVISNTQVQLNWETASEINNDYFEVERSADGSTWEELGKVQGAGNSSTINDYSFTDESPYSTNQPITHSTLFYRLRQTDYNGGFAFYGPLSVKLSAPDKWELILKNPAGDQLSGTFYSNEETGTIIEIFDLQGRLIKKENRSTAKGANLLNMNISGITPGTYVIKIYNANNFIVSKFQKMQE